MSQIQDNPNPTPSGLSRLGLILPGLGHLMVGRRLDGLGHLALLVPVLWAVVAGVPRLGTLLAAPGTPNFEIHPYVSLVAWVVAAVSLWRSALAVSRPAPVLTDAQRASQFREIWHQFRKNRMGVAGGYLVLVLMLLAFLTPMIAPFNPDQLDVGPHLAAPTLAHLMGTDDYGRDLFSRAMYGARVSLSIGFVAVTIAASIGTLVGSTTGYFGGWYDRALMWFTDLLLSLPSLVLLLAIIGFFRAAGAQSIFLIVTVLGLTAWMGIARIVRSQVLSLKEQDFIAATRALGLPSWRIITRHIIPNAIAPVIVYATLAIGGTILAEASLSFLGLGVPPPTATWGSLVNDGREYLRSGWWYTFFPGLMIVFSVMSFNLLGDGLRDALDPKLRGRG